jgi:SAM-dependent methyltransferase
VCLFRCASCRHCFTDLCSLAELEHYGPEYFDKSHKNWFEHPDVKLFDCIRRIIVNTYPNAAVLDAGSGNGNLLRYLREKEPRLRLTGIDIGPGRSADGIEHICADFLTWNFESQFDVVISLQVIEHMPDPQQFARRTSELCRSDGIVIVNTINEQSVLYDVARWARAVGFQRAYERLYSRHHLNHFNLSSLRALMEGNGLTTIQHLRHKAPVAAMDIPASGKLTESIFRAAVWGMFVAGDAIGRSTYQTIVCRK